MTSIATTISVPQEAHRAVARPGWHPFLRRHGFIFPSFLIAISVCFWFVTWGDGRLFDSERFTSFYDSQARSLLHGQFDVPPEAIGFEAFVRDGKSYGYFGIGPSLIRLPLVILFPNMDGRWSRAFMLLACGINLVCAYRLVLSVARVSNPCLEPQTRVENPCHETSRVGVLAHHCSLPQDALVGEYTHPTLKTGDRVTPISMPQKIILSLFILCAGIGSTTVFIASRSYTYHEAIMWGGTFALLFTDCLLSYLETPKLRLLAAAGLFAFLSFHSRATVGAGALLAMCVLIVILAFRANRGSIIGMTPIARPMMHMLLACSILAITVGVYFGVNFGKFRTFEGVPVRFYSLYLKHPERMQATGGRQFHIENVATGFASYVGAGGLRFKSEFPWAYMVQSLAVIGSPAIDVVEPYSSIPVSMPAIFFLALAGAWPIISGRTEILRRFRLPAVAFLLGGAIVLFTVGITERYLHDFYPFLIIAAAVGVCRLAPSLPYSGERVGVRGRASSGLISHGTEIDPVSITISSPTAVSPLTPTLSPEYGGEGAMPPIRSRAHGYWRNAALLSVLTLISIYLNCAFALEFQREIVWGVPQSKRQELVHARQFVDRFLHRTPVAAAGE